MAEQRDEWVVDLAPGRERFGVVVQEWGAKLRVAWSSGSTTEVDSIRILHLDQRHGGMSGMYRSRDRRNLAQLLKLRRPDLADEMVEASEHSMILRARAS